MTSLEEMRHELRKKFERLKGKKSNPGSPEELENCLSIRLTEEKDIEISFKDVPECRPVKDEYRDVLRAALVGAETIYKTLPRGSSGESSGSQVEVIRRAEKANVWEVDGTYTVHLYGPWAGARTYVGLKSVSFPALTKWERRNGLSVATFPGPTSIEVDLEKKIMSHR